MWMLSWRARLARCRCCAALGRDCMQLDDISREDLYNV